MLPMLAPKAEFSMFPLEGAQGADAPGGAPVHSFLLAHRPLRLARFNATGGMRRFCRPGRGVPHFFASASALPLSRKELRNEGRRSRGSLTQAHGEQVYYSGKLQMTSHFRRIVDLLCAIKRSDRRSSPAIESFSNW